MTILPFCVEQDTLILHWSEEELSEITDEKSAETNDNGDNYDNNDENMDDFNIIKRRFQLPQSQKTT